MNQATTQLSVNQPFDIQIAIEEIRFALDHVVSEERLYILITERLSTLRQSFRLHRFVFAPAHIEFLKSLNGIADHLKSFIDLREELVDVREVKDYEDLVSRLVSIKSRLGSFAVGKRIMKELRELGEMLPTVLERDAARKQSRTQARILDFEQNPPRCRHNHPMVLRGGIHGRFWGCSRYPFCQEAAPLEREQKALLRA